MAILPLLTLLVAAAPADTTLAFGAKFPSPTPQAIPLATVAAKPADWTGKEILVEGVITSVCQEMGCWIDIAADTTKGALPMHIDFQHKFFVPPKAKGMKARVLGTASLKTYTKDEADHLIEEGAKLTRNADGTATGILFVATGVVLTGTLGQ